MPGGKVIKLPRAQVHHAIRFSRTSRARNNFHLVFADMDNAKVFELTSRDWGIYELESFCSTVGILVEGSYQQKFMDFDSPTKGKSQG
jgi:hypothetical protein